MQTKGYKQSNPQAATIDGTSGFEQISFRFLHTNEIILLYLRFQVTYTIVNNQFGSHKMK